MQKHKPLNIKGSPYWCGVQDRLQGKKCSPHYFASIWAGSMKRWTPDRMMQVEIDDYMLGYNGDSE